MDTKHLIWIGVLVGGFVGGYIPSLWGAGTFSMSGIIFSMTGSLAGIYIGYKISQW